MQMLKAAFINEIFKISKKKKIVVATILSIGCVFITGLIANGLGLLGIFLPGGANFSLSILSALNYTLIPLFSAFICIDMFSGEFTNETVKVMITRPASRFKVFSSKVLAAAAFIMANLLFVMCVSLIMSIFVGSGSTSILKVLLAYVVSFFPLMTFALMVIVIANLAKGSASAFMLSIVVFIACLVIKIPYPNLSGFLFTSSINWHVLFMASNLNVSKIISTLATFIGYSTFFFACGYIIFERKSF